MPELDEIQRLVERQGEAFAAFKAANDQELTELKKRGADPVTIDKLQKIEKTLDDAVESKAKLEAAIAAEKKEREDLELRLNRAGVSAPMSDEAKHAADFTRQVNLRRHAKGEQPVELDVKQFQSYKAAVQAYMRKGEAGMRPDEIKDLQIGSDADGGFLVPADTTGRIVTKIYETSNIRGIANVATTSRDKLEGLEDTDEAGAAYSGERATSGNTKSPNVGKWDIQVFDIDTEPTATNNLLTDSEVDVEAWLANKVADKFARFENAEFCTGATKIRGFTSYDIALDAGAGVAWGSLGYIKTGVNGAFASTAPADKVFDLIGLLKEGYLNNARFVTRRSVITAMRKFKDSQNQYVWQPSLILGQPETFGGYPITRAEDMPALATNSLSLAFGDFREGYQVVDRAGIRIIRDVYTAKPKVKFYTHKRTGGGVLNFEAIKLLQFAA